MQLGKKNENENENEKRFVCLLQQCVSHLYNPGKVLQTADHPWSALWMKGAAVKVPLRDGCVCPCVVRVQSAQSPAGEVGEVEGGLMSPTHKPWLTQLGFRDLSTGKKIALNSAGARTWCARQHAPTHEHVHLQRWKETDGKKGGLNYCSAALPHVFKRITNHYALLILSIQTKAPASKQLESNDTNPPW